MKSEKSNNNGATIGFEEELWGAADKLRTNMDAAEYKHVVLGLIFLKYISDAFAGKYEELSQDMSSNPEDRDEYLSVNVFWVPKNARWKFLQSNAKDPAIGLKVVLDFTDLIILYPNYLKYPSCWGLVQIQDPFL